MENPDGEVVDYSTLSELPSNLELDEEGSQLVDVLERTKTPPLSVHVECAQ